jgi:uncharacterized protein YihD (DUF1040 family)
MRDPARIDEMLELLREVWLLQPDLRLGQLIYNAARMRDADLEDVFSIEDGSLRKGLVRYLELLRSAGAA